MVIRSPAAAPIGPEQLVVDSWTSRGLDLILASAIFIVTAPLWPVLALAVYASSPGPVFYVSQRAGRHGRPFRMYKFRSMYSGADRVGPGVTAGSDARVTSVGRFLRATKLDELPQLLNVVRGEMSLVGPRPEAPEYVATYDARQRRVLDVRPGMTGLTQLLYMREEQLLQADDVEREYRERLLPLKLNMDLTYIGRRTTWGDVRLILATAACMVGWEAVVRAETRRNGVEV